MKHWYMRSVRWTLIRLHGITMFICSLFSQSNIYVIHWKLSTILVVAAAKFAIKKKGLRQSAQIIDLNQINVSYKCARRMTSPESMSILSFPHRWQKGICPNYHSQIMATTRFTFRWQFSHKKCFHRRFHSGLQSALEMLTCKWYSTRCRYRSSNCWMQMQKHLRFQDLFQLHFWTPIRFVSLTLPFKHFHWWQALNVYRINYVFDVRHTMPSIQHYTYFSSSSSFFLPHPSALFTCFNQMKECRSIDAGTVLAIEHFFFSDLFAFDFFMGCQM